MLRSSIGIFSSGFDGKNAIASPPFTQTRRKSTHNSKTMHEKDVNYLKRNAGRVEKG
jgi:hypothetical protein